MDKSSPLQLGIFASGGGSNLQAIIDACASGQLTAQVALVISNNSSSGALQRARRHGIPALHLSRPQFDGQAAFDQAVLDALRRYKVDLVLLAGYMKKVAPSVVAAFRHRILNIHPALLPTFGGKGMYGLNVHKAVLEAGVKITGVTIHLVDEEYDHGPIVAQRAVPVCDDDSPETLASRVLTVEHQLYAEVVQWFAEGRVTVKGRRVYVS